MIKPAYLLAGMIGFGALLSLPAAAEIYKWTDESGAVHYGETPPPSNAKSQATLKVRTKLPEGAAEAQAAREKQLQKARAEKAEKEADKATEKGEKPKAAATTAAAPAAKEQYKEKCTQLRKDLDTLNSRGRIKVSDGKGDPRWLTEEEKKTTTDETQRSIKAFCES